MKCFLILVLFYSVEGFLDVYPKIPIGERVGGDAGEPLILTPYVESGDVTKGQRLAQVDIPGFPNITSFSGFFTVDKENGSNQFFWYFPPLDDEYENAPIIVWLQGGPGISSLFGLFIENGPFEIKEDKFINRNYTWAQTRHMIYIDNPVGTGFSFTNSGYCTDQNQVGQHLYSTVTQFLQLFPHLQGNDFYVAGESYAGKYAPALAYYIHKHNDDAKLKVNLKGIILGNGWTDPEHQLEYGEFLYQLGLIDDNEKSQLEEAKQECTKFIKQKLWVNATGSIFNMNGLITKFTRISLYNYLAAKNITSNLLSLINLAQTTSFRKGIHAGEVKFNFISEEVHDSLVPDVSKSVAPWISELLDHYKVVTYNGQLDIIAAYPLTVNFLKHLKFSAADEYLKSERVPIFVDEEVIGYSKSGGNLTEIMIRNAGHMAPADKPFWVYSMIANITDFNITSATENYFEKFFINA